MIIGWFGKQFLKVLIIHIIYDFQEHSDCDEVVYKVGLTSSKISAMNIVTFKHESRVCVIRGWRKMKCIGLSSLISASFEIH